ncbi:MAG TPA: hypothetical protein PLI70_01450 [Gemmatimonadales bacterium]|nr:hypothetical protein [Gemmatimonadales bacterium]HRZ08717.1 hypothetical protein [Gemmatimonadales bacterium]
MSHPGEHQPVAVSDTPGWRLFLEFFADAARRGLPLVPLRPRGRDPATALSGGDFDFLMPSDAFPLLVELLWQRAAAEGASFSINRTNPHKLQAFIHVPEAGRSIQLELWTRLEVRDPARRSARWIPWSAVAPLLATGDDGLPRLPLEIEIACYLSHLATRRKRVETPLVAERIAAYAALAAAAAPRLAPLLAGLTSAGIPGAAVAANARLRELGVLESRTPLTAALDTIRERVSALPWKWDRRLRRAARIIAVTGADGVGKSTVVARWGASLRGGLKVQRFKNLFRHHPAYRLYYHVRLAAARRRGGGQVPRNAFDEIHAAVMFDFARASWTWFRLLALMGGRRCLDRGFPDLLFGGLRGDGPAGLRPDWLDLAARMPQPDWHVHLDAPDAVILGRKQELSVDGLRAYRDGMARIVGAAPADAFSRIDTGRSIEEVEACLRMAAVCHGVRLPWTEATAASRR